MVFEGLVIHRVPYKERDLIVKLILRNGLLGSFYIYGGQGGGKHHKPSFFEMGSMMKITTRERSLRDQGQDLLVASEHQRVWEPRFLRHDVQAFYLSCLFFEILQKISQPLQVNSHGIETTEHEGLFSVVSNALFYMDESLKDKNFIPAQHLMLFMVKLLYHLGIIPDTENCSYCGSALDNSTGVIFLPANGQFSCNQCVSAENERNLWLQVKLAYQTHYQNYQSLAGATFQEGDRLIQYFCHQFHLKPLELKAYALLFK